MEEVLANQHNEETQDDSLPDLGITSEQAEQAKGGGRVVPTDQIAVNFAKIEFE